MFESQSGECLGQYLTVSQAAHLLGVSPWTLRNWDKAGRLKPMRHPKNGYRIYRQEQLTGLLGSVDKPGLPADRLAPQGGWGTMSHTEHGVQFYDTDAFLMDSVSEYLAPALESGDGGIVIATDAHMKGIERRLAARGVNVASLVAQGRYLPLDAGQTLEKLLVNGAPDADRFNQVLGTMVAAMSQIGRRPRAFGEMVALLWSAGNQQAAIRLEELWNDLRKTHAFSLLCGYPMHDFADGAQAHAFEQVCACHSRVMPTESYTALPDAAERTRAIANLQQKAAVLETEIAHRRQIEQQLSEREQALRELLDNVAEQDHAKARLAAIVESSDDAIVSKTLDGIIRSWNKSAERLFGYTEDEVVGKSITIIIPPERLDEERLILSRLSRGEHVDHFETVRLRKDGSPVQVSISVAPLRDRTGRIVGASKIARDITERRRIEQALLDAHAAAEQANRAKDQFLAILSHELRTPLTPVLLGIEALLSEPDTSPRLREQLLMFRRNLSLETRLIDDLLDLSRVINGKLALHRQNAHLHALIHNVMEMVRPDAQARRLQLELDLKAENDRLYADPARIQQVLLNLLKNAVKFTPDDGRITVRTRNDNADQHRLIVEVQDTGIGIDPVSLPTIFDPFEQGGVATNRQFGGLGLGLAICRAIAHMHAGRIRAHSEGKGRGARFTLELPNIAPATDAQPAQSPTAAHPAARSAGGVRPLRVLLVDDHADTLRAMQRLLRHAGHTVVTAHCVAQAVQQVEQDGFDVVISDIGLPDGSGLDVMRQARKRHPQLPGIALTGFGMEQDVSRSEAAGFSVHLTKPVDMAQLHEALRQLCA
jgi:PAS domain S-box-containing protein